MLSGALPKRELFLSKFFIVTIEQIYSIFRQYPSVQTDTRKLKQGDLFFALKGNNFNGNLFAEQALQQGAAYAVIDEPQSNNAQFILVDDVLSTLQQLAKYHRKQFNIPFIAITGSNGKTTTKELVSAVLSSQYKTYTTQGNLNNHIGIPLTILSVKKDARFAVIEMGANHLHEIESYCQWALPTHGIITNCGKAHLEGFGGEEGVRKGKGELYDALRSHAGTAFAFDDYDYLHEMSKGIAEVIWYGTNNGLVCGQVKQSEPYLHINITKGTNFNSIETQLVGSYNLPNMLCAITVGKYFKVDDDKIKAAIENYVPSNSRSQMMVKGTNHFILDAYNANPSSMQLAIENFAKIKADKKVLILGAMMELGNESLYEHEQLVKLIEQYKWNDVILVGGDFEKVNHHYRYFSNSIDAGKWLYDKDFKGYYFLIKGSRSMQMEKALPPSFLEGE